MKHAVPGLAVVLAASLAFANGAAAQYAYPAKGQSPSRQAKDEAECSKWATGKTGFDPARPPVAAPATPAPVNGSGARLRGAAGGAIVAGVAGGDAGAGALAGAAVGGLARRASNRRAADAQNQANAQAGGAMHASYDRARSACLSGRGYSVK